MSLEELITSLSLEAESEKEKVLLAAQDEAVRILERALEDVEKTSRGPQNEAARRLGSEKAKRLFAARVEGRGLIRRAQGEVLDAVVRKVLELVEARAGSRGWGECLQGLVLEAASGMPGGVFHVRPSDREAAAAAAAGLPGAFRVVPDKEMAPGVRLVSDDGLIEVDNTFATRLGRYLAIKEAAVANLVFPTGRNA